MKKVNSCSTENCIPISSSCVEWNGGEVEFLGVCNGTQLNTLMWEVLTKLESITGDDLSSFDIDSLVSVCSTKAPLEVTILSILETVRDNQLCLKDYIDAIRDQISELSRDESIDVNLKCLADFDNLGNSLVPDRKTLDQLVINQLCEQKARLTILEGKVALIQNTTTESTEIGQQSFSTCIDSGVKTNSQQTVAISQALCDLRTATGTPADIASTLSVVPSDWNTKYSSLTGWKQITNEASMLNNLLLVIKTLEADIYTIKNTCCAVSCDDIKVGFSAMFGEDSTSIILKFSAGAGTSIPAGFVDKGSTGTIKDSNGNIQDFSLGILNNLEQEVFIYNLSTSGALIIEINYKIGNDSLVCEKTITKTIQASTCQYCELLATGDNTASAVVVYYDPNSNTVAHTPTPIYPTTTTTTTIP